MNLSLSIYKKIFIGIFLIFLMLVGAYVRFAGIGEFLFSPDDAFVYWLATVPAPIPPYEYNNNVDYGWLRAPFIPREHWFDIINITPLSGHPAFYYLILHLLTQISEDPIIWRLSALVPGLLSIPLAYAIGRQASGVLSGMVAALLLTFSDAHIVYSQEIRSYSLFLFILLCAFFSILRFEQNKKTIWLAAYFLFSFLAIFTHYGAVIPIFLIGSIGIFKAASFHLYSITALLRDKNIMIWSVLHAMMAAFYLWQNSMYMEAADEIVIWLKGAGVFSLAFMHLFTLLDVPIRYFFYEGGFFCAITLFMFGFGLWSLYRDKRYVWLYAVVGMLLLAWLLLIINKHPYYSIRHFTYLVPAMLLVISYPFSRFVRIDGVRNASILMAIFLAVMAVNLFAGNGNGLQPDRYRLLFPYDYKKNSNNGRYYYGRYYTATRSDWRAMVERLNQQTKSGDILIISSQEWLVVEREKQAGEIIPNLVRDNQIAVCRYFARIEHINEKPFNRCLDTARRQHADSKRFWYISPYQHLHINSYEGEPVAAHANTILLEQKALEKIQLPTVTAYALPIDFRLPEKKKIKKNSQ